MHSGGVRGPGWGRILCHPVPARSRRLQSPPGRNSLPQEERGVPRNEEGLEAIRAIRAHTEAKGVIVLLASLPSREDSRLRGKLVVKPTCGQRGEHSPEPVESCLCVESARQ